MTAPEVWRSPVGEDIVLAEVDPAVRRAAITISFGTDTGPWWECIPIARTVLNDFAGDLARQITTRVYGSRTPPVDQVMREQVDRQDDQCTEVEGGGVRCAKPAGHRGLHAVAWQLREEVLGER